MDRHVGLGYVPPVGNVRKADVAIIGAGPAGSSAAALLRGRGHSVVVVERASFPRPVIGESLLPRCNELLEAAGLWPAVKARRYMLKHGATFLLGDKSERFCFAEALKGDAPSALQVPRDDFDQTLAAGAAALGASVEFRREVTSARFDGAGCALEVLALDSGASHTLQAGFVLDCSGFGQVLPRLLDLPRSPGMAERVACYAQFRGDVRPAGDLEGDIWICCHPQDGWIWLIPFSDGRTSVGLVCSPERFDALTGTSEQRLMTLLHEEPNTARRLVGADLITGAQVTRGYGSAIDQLHGPRWALVGNAGGFLDPIFSSGVTLALESAAWAADLVDRELRGKQVDWNASYTEPMGRATAVYRAFVDSWYAGDLQEIFFADVKPQRVKQRITSILAGHALRDDNSLTRDTADGLRRLHGYATGR